MIFHVICTVDGRTHGPFATEADASTWAEWGHCCLAGHTVTESVGEWPYYYREVSAS